MIETASKPASRGNAVVVCAGSGVHFPVYFGAMQALTERGYSIQTLGGVSGGGLATGLFAIFKEIEEGDALAALSDIRMLLSRLKLKKYIRLCPMEFFRGYLYNRDRLNFYLEDVSQKKTFADIRLSDLKIIATDILTAKPTVFSSKTSPDCVVSLAMMASSALPFAFEPVYIGDTYYVDGGVTQDIPYEEFKDAQAHEKFVLFPESGTLLKNLGSSPSGFDILKRSLDVYMSSSETYQKILAAESGFRVVSIDVSYVSSVDFSVSSEILLREWDSGYHEMVKVLDSG